ncbi:MAG TPA: LuxR C-terminal-related transcriptional regulator [Candidatus Limnocylindrales bacterium]|nr:LuxR C-terminal-related transcriptional regulator [Candidatus Limnocylindrales bacterium]
MTPLAASRFTDATPFVGRSRELAEIARLLTEPNCRLLTLVGLGGMGKTRLAQVALREQAGRHADGGFFVPLEALSSPEQTAQAIAAVLNVRLNVSGDPARALIQYLRPMHILLVLDNFEHLIEGAEFLSELLAEAPRVQLLVTSRERLRLVEEWVYDVAGLDVPTDAACEAVVDFSALQLYAASARRVQPRFSLEEDCTAVVRICRLLEGMPLALELAASWARALSTEEIGHEIERSLDILNTSARNVPEGHRCMRAVLDQSWAMLTDAQRSVFARLSVFRGGFRSDATEVVAQATRADLAELLDKSWLRRSSDTGRYSLHELARQYGAERLHELNGDEFAIRQRHARFYAEFLDAQWSRLRGDDYKAAYQDIEAELDNIRTAWRWNVEHLNLIPLHQSLRSFWVFFDSGSRFREGEQLLSEAVIRVRRAGPEYHALLGRLLARQGALQFSLDQFLTAQSILEESLALLHTHDLPEDTAFAELELGMTLLFCQDTSDEGIRLFRSALATYEALHDAWGAAYARFWIGLALTYDYGVTRNETLVPEAKELLECSEREFQAIGNIWGMASVHAMLSNLADLLGDHIFAWELACSARDEFAAIGVTWGVSNALQMMVASAGALGWQAETRRAMLDALRIELQYRLFNHALQPAHMAARLRLDAGDRVGALEILAAIDTQRLRLGRAPDPVSLPLLDLLDEVHDPPEAAAVAQGRARPFESIVQEIIAALEGERPTEHPASETTSANGALLEPLTERELEILQLVADGRSNREIAAALYLSVGTVKTHIHNLTGKLGASNRTEAAALARRYGLLGEPAE